MEEGKLAKMIMDAEQYAASQIKVRFFDGSKRQTIKLQNITEVMKYWKYQDYKQIYDNYIAEEYGWKYTYEQLEIALTGNIELTQMPIQGIEGTHAKKEINQLLVKSIQNTFEKRVSNAERKYRDECEQIKQAYLNDPNIKFFWDNNIIGMEDIYKHVNIYRYNDNFLERMDYFCQYEVKFDTLVQESVNEWIGKIKNKRIPPK